MFVNESVRIFLGIYGTLFLILMFLRVYLVWKKTGTVPIAFGRSDSLYDFVGVIFKRVLILIAIIVSIIVFIPEWYSYLIPISYFEILELRIPAMVLLILSFLLVVIAQAQMGKSFKIGIDANAKTSLVANGLYVYSRNPIYLGMIGSIIGQFLLVPNVFTLIILFFGWLLVQIQVRLEEDFLSKLHGESFTTYCQKVRRWL